MSAKKAEITQNLFSRTLLLQLEDLGRQISL